MYRPLQAEWKHRGTDRWRTDLGAELRRRGFWYVDLVDELRALPFWRTWELFIPPGAVKFVGAAGHYTVAGDRGGAPGVFHHLFPHSPFAPQPSAFAPPPPA